MLKTYSKKVREQLRIDVLENFAETAEYERKNGNPDATPLSCLVKQIDYMRYNNRSIHETALDYIEGGSMLVYYHDVLFTPVNTVYKCHCVISCIV